MGLVDLSYLSLRSIARHPLRASLAAEFRGHHTKLLTR